MFESDSMLIINKAYFDIAWAPDPTTIAPFSLVAVIDASHPSLMNQVIPTKTTDDCSCCGGGGEITATATLGKTGFVMSELIVGNFSVTNNSKATISKIKCRLVQKAVHQTHSQ